ncbi:unnamed protein product [Mesocestoides corti]|uniref:Transmembrane protein 70 n=1 Tax=Mesocestoides corti TaxID=53468 RepID=A0A0R3UMJ6_MESCO|nr:unnamed protein product [Mesocestoides corti]
MASVLLTRTFSKRLLLHHWSRTPFLGSFFSSFASSKQIYTCPISNLVIGVKLFSLTSSSLVLAAQPFIFSKFTSFASYTPFLVSSLAFAALTPILLHILTRSCVFLIRYNPDTGRFAAYTKSIFLRPKKVEFNLDNVSYSVSSLSFANMTVNNKTPLFVLESGFSDLQLRDRLFGLDKPIKFS